MQNACKTDGDAEHDGIRVPQQIADWVMPLFTQHVDRAWYFCKSECVIIMNTSLNHMITNSFWLFCGILDNLIKNGCQFTKETVSRMFWFCIAWSLAGMLEKKDRDCFDMYVRPLQPGSPAPPSPTSALHFLSHGPATACLGGGGVICYHVTPHHRVWFEQPFFGICRPFVASCQHVNMPPL